MRVSILALVVSSCVFIGCRSRTPGEDPVKDSAGPERLVIRVEGMAKVEGLTWLGWPNRVQEALEGLPGVRISKVVLGEDRFDLEYDPAASTPEHILQVVSELGYQPQILREGGAAAAGGRSSSAAHVDLESMSPAIEAARREAATSRRGILIEFSGKGWSACEQMDAETYPDSRVQKALSGWVVVRVEVTSEPEVARRCGVEGVPTLLALTAEGIELGRVEGFVDVEDLVRRLNTLRPD